MGEINIVVGGSDVINVNISDTGGRLPYYTDCTTVTPRVGEAVTLATANRSVRDNITVERVPSYSVHNPSGGNTFIIGG